MKWGCCFRWLIEVPLSKQVSSTVQELITWAVRLAGTRLDPDVVIRPHHREKGNFVARGCGGRRQAEHLEGKLTVPRAKQKVWWLGRKDAPYLCPLAPQPLPASYRPQIFFGGNFLLKCNIHIWKCKYKWQLNEFSQRQHTRVNSPQTKEQITPSPLEAPFQPLLPSWMVTITLISNTNDYFCLFLSFM